MLSFAESTVVFPATIIDRVLPSGAKSISLMNTGGESVTPTFALTDAANFAIESTTCESLAPGASCELVVRFGPHTLGAHSADLVATASGSSVSTKLIGVAQPEPGLMAVPTLTFDYQDVAVGATKTLELEVWNRGAVTSRPYSVALTGTDAQDFTLVDDACSGFTAAPNEACSVDVTFSPSAINSRTAQLVVSSGNLGSLIVDLNGNGYLPAELSVSPGSGMFGSVFAFGDSPPQSFTVTNSGTVPTPELQVAISGTGAQYFAIIDGCSGSTLAGGASCMFSIVYHPRTVGMHQATATVSAGSLVPVVVPLTGSGEPAQMQITPSGWDFYRVLVGQTADAKTFTIENTGATNTGPLAIDFSSPSSVFTLLNDGCTGVDLAPSATCTLGVTATPAVRGYAHAGLVVTATRGDRVFGLVQVQGIIPAALTGTPGAVAFGDVQMTESAGQVITISNPGDVATGTIAVAVVGADSADVTLVDNCSGTSLPWLGSCSLAVAFSPSHLGAETATIEITSPGATLTIPVTANTLPAPELTVSPNTLVLNPVAVGESYARTFEVQGTGGMTGPLAVAVTGANAADYVVTDDNCSGQTVASGQACSVTLTLTPSGTGSRNAVLVVSAQPGGYRKVPLTAIAFTQATLTISRTSVMFAATGVGQTNTYGFLTITNAGQLPTGALSVQLVGMNPTEFGIIADTCTGAVLAPYAQCSVHTQFAPTMIASSTASLVVSAAPGGTVSAALSGTGLPPPQISSMITSYAFPPQETFTNRGHTFQIENIGGSPTDHLHATLSGPQADRFRAFDYSCANIPAGSWCYLEVEFEPIEVGQANATLTVESELAGSVTIALTGTATPGTKIVVSPATYDFGFIAAGQSSAPTSFTATNIGQRDLLMLHTFVPYQCDNFEVVSTSCGSTLAPNASCQADVVFHPVSSSYFECEVVFVEDTLLKGKADLNGQSSL